MPRNLATQQPSNPVSANMSVQMKREAMEKLRTAMKLLSGRVAEFLGKT